MNEITIKDLYKIELIPRAIMLAWYVFLVLVDPVGPLMVLAIFGIYALVEYFFLLAQFLNACQDEDSGSADTYKSILNVFNWANRGVWVTSLLTYCYGNF